MSANARISSPSLRLFMAQCFNALSFQFHAKGRVDDYEREELRIFLTLTIFIAAKSAFLVFRHSLWRERENEQNHFMRMMIFFPLGVNAIKFNLFSI